ncbi:MAG: hypothetical protein ACE5GH_06355, partial [Fidelibacterota bacterium]
MAMLVGFLCVTHASPVLTLSKTGELEVLPGDTIRYALSYSNTGTDAATGVTVVDTLPQLVSFVDASQPYDYSPGNPSIITWDLGTLPPGTSGELLLQVWAVSGFGEGEQIVNTAWITSGEGATDSAIATTTNILPMTIDLSAHPKAIMGDGISSSTLSATVYTFLGNPVPDGIPVSFTQDIGSIPEGLDTVDTRDGMAMSTLISDVMTQGSRGAIVNGRANFTVTEFASDTTRVIFVLGAFEGFVMDYSGNPIPGASVQLVRESTGLVVGRDSTGIDGSYFVPVHLRERYHFAFTTSDQSANPVSIQQPVIIDVPTGGSVVANLNSLSGWLLDKENGDRIEEAGIPVIISPFGQDLPRRGFTQGGDEQDTTYTDSTGFYVFTNLQSGMYNVDVVYHGILAYEDARIEVDLVPEGAYIANANITVNRRPFYTYKTVDRLSAEREDTLSYKIVYGSTDATIPQRVYIVDNLPGELTFIENSHLISDGVRFDSYDPISNEVTFTRDGLGRNQANSLTFMARVDGDLSSIDPGSQTGTITNVTIVTQLQDTVSSSRDSRSRATTKIFLDILSVKKEANRRSVEPGDFVTYTVRLKNQSDKIAIHHPIIHDVLPYGFRYRPERSYWESER